MPPHNPLKPAWLTDQVYANISEDAATPEPVRAEALHRVSTAPDAAAAGVAFTSYISSVLIPDVPATLPVGDAVNHLFYAMGFFKRIAEVTGSADELTVASEFAKIRDAGRPRRERRKILARIGRVMQGAPIRSDRTVWLYKTPQAPAVPTSDVLRTVDACTPWQLALPRVDSGSEYVHFELRSSDIQGCRTPNCRDAGFNNLELWRHGGQTQPHSRSPAPCSAAVGFGEVVAHTPNYESAIQPLGWCTAV